MLREGLLAIVFTFAIVYLCSSVTQQEGYIIIGLYSLAFISYGYLIRYSSRFIHLIILGVLVRFVLVFLFPNLSDDIYRFIWDGHLISDGYNPLSYTPKDFLISHSELADNSIYAQIYPLLNSPEYFTVYPPISQFVYWLASFASSVEGSAIIMKTIFFLAELGSCFLLLKILMALGKPRNLALWYFLNPLVIVELTGQLHFEAFMIFFLLAGIWFLLIEKPVVAGSMMAFSIGAKLLPLMFIPLILKYLFPHGWIKFLLSLALTCTILFVPMFYGVDIANFFSSLGLYYQSFEFNASVYYLLRAIGYAITGYNQIAILGPLLSVIALIAILIVASKVSYRDRVALIWSMFLSLAIYLFFTTTVHPWYIVMLLMLSVFVNQWWVIVWSGVVVWSYTTYMTEDFTQNLYLISLEYVVVLVCMFWNYRSKNLRVGDNSMTSEGQ